jgi:ABC-2 type transport system permease protein
MKLLVRDKITVMVFCLASSCFFFICATLNFSAESQSRIPIGFANHDVERLAGEKAPTELSQELVDTVTNSTSFRVSYGDLDSLKEAMADGELESIFVINRGYQERIMSGSTSRLITVYKSAESKMSMFLSDIFAGEMLDQICLQKSWLKYRDLDFEGTHKLTKEEYREYVNQIRQEEEFESTFEVELTSTDSINVNYEKLNNSVLYRQIVAGIFAMLLSFVVLFSFTYVCMEKEQGIQRRKKLAISNRLSEHIGTIVAVLATTGLLCLIFVFCICYYTNTSQAFWPLLALSMEYACIMALIFMLLVRVTKGVIAYQMLGSVLILCLGMLGFCIMVDGVVFKNLINVLENTPNGWFIRKFVDIIVKTY